MHPSTLFADGFRAGTGSCSGGRRLFDADSDHDIACPIRQPPNPALKTSAPPEFVQSTILFPTIAPGVIKLFDFDGRLPN
jgi:hypothetical protein